MVSEVQVHEIHGLLKALELPVDIRARTKTLKDDGIVSADILTKVTSLMVDYGEIVLAEFTDYVDSLSEE